MSLIMHTDSYKVTHHLMYPKYQKETEKIYSYFESRSGALYPSTVFFGLTYFLQKLLNISNLATKAELDILHAHFGQDYVHSFFKENRIILPIHIKAVDEGSVIPTSNVLMTIENTDPKFPFLTNYLESYLSHLWYPCTVATISYNIKVLIQSYLEKTSVDFKNLPFMLHDFGYRGVSSDESAAIGGAAHLINFLGTDNLLAMNFLYQHYRALPCEIGYSVPATEHSVMTSLGEYGESHILDHLFSTFPTGILSVVADSYDIYNFVSNLVCKKYKETILNRDGVFVVRPDSVTDRHGTPADLTIYILDELFQAFNGTYNSKGYKVLNPKIRILWGDGLVQRDIHSILARMMYEKYSAENIVFGMGGGLLQKCDRDTQRFAFKCSAQKRDGIWYPTYKTTYNKASKRGRLALVKNGATYQTLEQCNYDLPSNLLKTVYYNGNISKEYLQNNTLAKIRDRINLA